MRIGNDQIGPGQPAYVIAEMSANHGGDLDHARELVIAAADAGVNAIKVQTFTADTITIDSERPEFRISAGTVWDGQTLHELYRQAAMPWEWQRELKLLAESRGIAFFSSPFDPSAVAFLESIEVPAYKIASAEIVDIGLIRRVASTGKPMIISTGMATFEEIEEGVAAARDAGAVEIALLKCTSAYPAPPEEVNLRTIPHLAETFGLPVGLSDHTMGIAVPVAAVAVGAAIVEKHVTLRRADGGPDAGFSLEPSELADMVDQIRVAERALGEVSYTPTAREADSRSLRRSLFVVADIHEGDLFTDSNVRSIRPAHGLHTRHLPEVLGRRAGRDVERGTPLDWGMVAEY